MTHAEPLTKPDSVRTALAVKDATMFTEMPLQVRQLHAFKLSPPVLGASLQPHLNRTRNKRMSKQTFIQRGMRLLMTFALLAVMTACNSTQIQSSRHPAGMSAAPFRSVMVVGVDQRPEVRDPFENDAVAFLQERGVQGTASYTRFSFDEIKGDKEQLRQQFLATGAQSVLFVRVTDRADFVDGPPVSLGSMDAGGVDESVYNAFTTPGGDINSAWRIGARLYRVSDGTVIWSCLLQTVMKEDADSLAFMRGVAKDMVERMAKDKAIP